MTDWICPQCEWFLSVDPTDSPPLCCHECGTRTEPKTDPESLRDAETQTDKLC